MKTNPILVAAAALTLLAACRPDDLAMESMEAPVPVRLAYTTVSVTETRAAQNLNEDVLAGGETVHVRIGPAYATVSSIWTNYSFTASADGTLTTTGTPPYYPAGSQNIDIVAFSPDLSTLLYSGVNFAVSPDQTSDASYKASDLMFASVKNQGKQAVPVILPFTHKTAKLCVNVTAGDGVTSIRGVRINQVKTAASFDVLTGRMGDAAGPSTHIDMSNNGAACFPPQTITGDLLSVATDLGVATYSVPDGKTFEAGKVYTMNIPLNRRAIGVTTEITGWTGEGTVTVNPPDYLNAAPRGAEAVDLGLSVKWANMNVGAIAETDYGTYFAWGETKGCTVTGATMTPVGSAYKTCYDWYTYVWCNGIKRFTKYFTYAFGEDFGWDERINNGTPDNKTDLDPCDDAARVNWGGNWRMPTENEILELTATYGTADYTWTWCDGSSTKYKGSDVAGWMVLCHATDASIFLPAAGCMDVDGNNAASEAGRYGNYWSSHMYGYPYPQAAYRLSFSDTAHPVLNSYLRYIGMPVRAVQSN